MIKQSPWDTIALGIPSFELTEYTEHDLDQACAIPGHYTIKVDPLSDKALLQAKGFYYCDTLLATVGTPARFPKLDMPTNLHVSRSVDPERVLAICHGAFVHGRFHRDFNLPHERADLRYDNWTRQLLDSSCVYGLFCNAQLGGFIGISGNSLVLHAVAPDLRGQGLAKFWWHGVIGALFAEGHATVVSSISASNVAVVNLYASLGFSFQQPQDIYHRITL